MSETPRFDPESSWLPLEARIAQESDARKRKLLTEVRDHMRAEIRGELGPLMDTLTAEPRYHMWGFGPAEIGPKGRDAVHVFYQNMIDGGGNRFHFDIRRIVVDDGAVVTEGAMIQPLAGRALVAAGVSEVEGEPVDPDVEYLSEWQIITVWPGDAEGKLVGEDIYMGSQPMQKLRRP